MPNLYPSKPTSKRDMIKLRMAEHQNILNEAAAQKEAEDKAAEESKGETSESAENESVEE